MDAFAFRMHLLSPTKAGSDLVQASTDDYADVPFRNRHGNLGPSCGF